MAHTMSYHTHQTPYSYTGVFITIAKFQRAFCVSEFFDPHRHNHDHTIAIGGIQQCDAHLARAAALDWPVLAAAVAVQC